MANSRESGPGQHSEFGRRESPYLFFNPETLLTPEMRQWLRESSIVHIAPPWLAVPRTNRTYGGIEDVVDNNVAALADFGAKRQVIFGHPRNKSLERSRNNAQVVTPFHEDFTVDLLNRWLRNDPEGAQKLEQTYVRAASDLIEEMGDATIVHDHTAYGRWMLGLGIPVVRTEHGPLAYPAISREEESTIKSFWYHEGLGFVAISQSQKAQMPTLHWLGVNYNGVNLNDFEYRENKANYLLYLGRVSHPKGAHHAVQVALATGIPLRIAGAVEDREYYAKAIKPYLDGNFIRHYEGGVDTEERKELYSKARCLLMLIEWEEPFGMVMPEALASGTPVVGFRKGSVPEVVQEGTGFVVDTESQAGDAVRAIVRGNYSPQKCRRLAEERFSAEAMAAGYAKIYREHAKCFIP
jgi:glycosyltransferase involved in cell wall biosynthesis